MTSEKLKPARDVWLIDEKDRRISGVVIAEPTGNGGNSPVAIVLTKSGHGNARLAKARAEFIAEAGTVFHECGLSPRELLDKNQDYKAQNARLTVALRNLCKHFPTDADMAELGWEVEYVETACQAYDTARAVLAKQKE